MIEPIGIEENKKNEEVVTATRDETTEVNLPINSGESADESADESTDESTDNIELEAVSVEPDAQAVTNGTDPSENNEQFEGNELLSEKTQEENEDKKKIEELSATLEKERADHRDEINSLKKEIVSLSPLPNFEKEMLEELIALREGYFRMKRNYEEKDEDFFDKDKTLRLIDDIASQLETILFNYSVEMSHSNISDPYNPRIHQAVKVIPTDDASVGGTVESSLGELYIYKGRTIQKERVNVYKLNKN